MSSNKSSKAERERQLIKAAEEFNAVVRGPSTKAALRDAKARLMTAVSEVQQDEPSEFARMACLSDAELLRQLHERIYATYRRVVEDSAWCSPERMLERIDSALSTTSPRPQQQ